MILYCDYCGAQIDTERYLSCPCCGGSYSRNVNSTVTKAEPSEPEGTGIQNETTESSLMNEMRKSSDPRKNIAAVKIAVAAAVLIVIAFLAIKLGGVISRTGQDNSSGNVTDSSSPASSENITGSSIQKGEKVS